MSRSTAISLTPGSICEATARPGLNGDTALHHAVVTRGELDVVRYLVEHGADLGAKNGRGQTPVEAAKASRKDRSDIVKYFAER